MKKGDHSAYFLVESASFFVLEKVPPYTSQGNFFLPSSTPCPCFKCWETLGHLRLGTFAWGGNGTLDVSSSYVATAFQSKQWCSGATWSSEWPHQAGLWDCSEGKGSKGTSPLPHRTCTSLVVGFSSLLTLYTALHNSSLCKYCLEDILPPQHLPPPPATNQ